MFSLSNELLTDDSTPSAIVDSSLDLVGCRRESIDENELADGTAAQDVNIDRLDFLGRVYSIGNVKRRHLSLFFVDRYSRLII
jgi:hypothetical protein